MKLTNIYMSTMIKILLMGCVTLVLVWSRPASATSVREYQNMTTEEKSAFLLKEANDLLAKVKAYDPTIEAKTRSYMLDETNQYGVTLGMGAVLAVVDVAEKKRPETTDKVQMETITKVIIRNYWRDNGIAVPGSVLGLKEPATSKPAAAASSN